MKNRLCILIVFLPVLFAGCGIMSGSGFGNKFSWMDRQAPAQTEPDFEDTVEDASSFDDEF